jgi:hypothetical protein
MSLAPLLKVLVTVYMDCSLRQNESNMFTTVITGRKRFAVDASYLMAIPMNNIVNYIIIDS